MMSRYTITWANERRKLRELIPWPDNPRQIEAEAAERLGESLDTFGQIHAIAIGPDNTIYDGHQRQAVWSAIDAYGPDYEVDVRVASRPLTEEERQKLVIFLHRGTTAEWDWDTLATFDRDDLLEWGFEEDELPLEWEEPRSHPPAEARQTLAERFVVPPFTVLDARQGYWRQRKEAWIDLGIRGGQGRTPAHAEGGGEGAVYDGKYEAARYNADLPRSAQRALGAYMAIDGSIVKREIGGHANPINKENIPNYYRKRDAGMTDAEIIAEYESGLCVSGASIFDPVLCEVAYRWFAPPGGHVLDPFAGEATKGIVAAYLGYRYTGIELRPEQIEANEVQAAGIGVAPTWICGDSAQLDALLPEGERYDLVFTSPPYYDLEVYSESEQDGSAFASYDRFMTWYRDIFAQAVARLRENRFLVVKVGEIRDQAGIYRNFLGDNLACFIDLGLAYYNEAVLVTALGSLPIRVGHHFEVGRKLGKTHQNILVFYKGDPGTIRDLYPAEIEYADLDAAAA